MPFSHALERRTLGPGLDDTKNELRPARSSAAIWYIVALE
jgi:hypothetical protein